MNTKTVVSTKCDFESDGKQFGYLDLPSSQNESAWGLLRFPICTVKNGTGPTVLLVAGNHGDEYEGQVALHKLARSLEPEQINGRVIILPALNYPAVKSATRVSPIDGLNMNRVFPGRNDGSVSQVIAHYVTTVLLPLADVVVDFHSGGKTLEFEPFACIHHLNDPDIQARSRALLRAFDAPLSLELEEIDNRGMLDTTVENSGKLFLATEIGGGGTASAKSVEIAERGVRNVLRHVGILRSESSHVAADVSNTKILETSEAGSFIHSNHDGLFEMLVDLGDDIQVGDAVGQVHSLTDMQSPPALYTASRPGRVIGRHFPGLIKQGDFLALIAGNPRSE